MFIIKTITHTTQTTVEQLPLYFYARLTKYASRASDISNNAINYILKRYVVVIEPDNE